MVEAAEVLGVEVDDFLIVGLEDEEKEDDHSLLESELSFENDQSFQCDQCNYKTGDKYQLKIHISAKHARVMYGCDECDHQSAYKKNINRHMRRAHKPPFPYTLGEDDREEWSEGEIGKEENEESVVEEKNKDAIENLVKLELYGPAKGRDKEKKSNSQKSQQVLYTCDQCIFKTQDKYHLKKHIIAKHTGIRYDCGECNYQSAYKKSIKRHRWGAHKTIAEPAVTCAQCDNKYPFHSQDHLRKHVKKHHNQPV